MPRAAARLRIASSLLLLALASACATISVPSPEPVNAREAREAWARVLDRHVTPDGRVDFAALQRAPRDLERYVSYIASAVPEANLIEFPSNEARLAHYLNSYNALAMYGVLRAGIPQTNAGLRKIPFFFFRRYAIGGRSESLFRYEGRIRALGDPRVHFALNCMSVSCPTLPRVPFEASDLDRTLDRLARTFFTDGKHLRVDTQAQTVRASSILKFYTDDFLVKSASLVEYINLYRDPDIPLDYDVRFLPYDWTINRSDGPVQPEPPSGG